MYDDELQEREYDSGYEDSLRRRTARLPKYCMIVFIIDLVFCVIRIAIVGMGFVGYQILKEQGSPLFASVPYEIIIGAAIVLFGIAGNGLMLAKKTWAVALGWLTLASTLGSSGVGIWQTSIILDNLAQNGAEAELIGAYIGAGFTILLRAGIVFAYLFALLKFSGWSQRQQTETTW
jgi:hypothetical protein